MPGSTAARVLVVLTAGVAIASCDIAGSSQGITTTSAATTTSTLSSPTSEARAQHPSATTSEPDSSHALLVVGDWGAGTRTQREVASAMARLAAVTNVEAIVTTGDNFYIDDLDAMVEPFAWAIEDLQIPFWIAWGNHDVESPAREQVVNEVFGDTPRWTVRQWGALDLVFLDSNQVTSLPQAAFFLDAMRSSSRPTVVVLHHPPFSCTHREATTDVVEQWVAILDQDVFLVLAGHDHSYQRFEHNGVQYVVTGGGGAALQPLQECSPDHPERLAASESHHFLVLTQSEGVLNLRALDVDGRQIDSISIDLP